jgi:Family of unknown function (DUF5336)
MAYSSGGRAQYPTQSSPAYGAHWSQPPGAASQPIAQASQLLWVVLLLGLATYIFSYAAARGDTAWEIRFSTSAAIVAALGLLPRQSSHTKLMAALATMGFLDALSQLIAGDQRPTWATIVIAVLIALQALTAIAMLLTQLREFRAADRWVAPYDPYSYYAQTAQQYYAAQNQQPQQPRAQAHETSRAQAAAAARAEQSAAQRHAIYAEYLSAQQSGTSRPAGSAEPSEPTQTAQPAAGAGAPARSRAESIRPVNDAATGTPTQSF